jgi:hypothetical protein
LRVTGKGGDAESQGEEGKRAQGGDEFHAVTIAASTFPVKLKNAH